MVTATVKQNNLQKIMTDHRSRMWQKWEGSCILTVKSNSCFQKKYYLGKTVQVYEHICLPNYLYPVPLGYIKSSALKFKLAYRTFLYYFDDSEYFKL